MQFNLQDNIDSHNELKKSLPPDLFIPFNAGRRVGQAPDTRKRPSFPTAVPSYRVSLLEWINAKIADGSIDLGNITIGADSVSFIPTLPVTGINLQDAVTEIIEIINNLPVYTFENGITNDSDTIKLGGDITENTSIGVDSFDLEIESSTGDMSFMTTGSGTITLGGSNGTLNIEAPSMDSPGNILLLQNSSTGEVEYSPYNLPLTTGNAGEALTLDVDGESLVWSPILAGSISHDTLLNLTNDDHTQYHNDTRGDIRYYLKSEVDLFLTAKAPLVHNHDVDEITATGTLDSTTFLRGDGTWSVPVDTDTTYTGSGGGVYLDGSNFIIGGTLTSEIDLDANGEDIAILNGSSFQVSGSSIRLLGGSTWISGTSILIRTPEVLASNATVGQVLKLTNTDGTAEWANESGGSASSFSEIDNGKSKMYAKAGTTLDNTTAGIYEYAMAEFGDITSLTLAIERTTDSKGDGNLDIVFEYLDDSVNTWEPGDSITDIDIFVPQFTVYDWSASLLSVSSMEPIVIEPEVTYGDGKVTLRFLDSSNYGSISRLLFLFKFPSICEA